jgi:anaerobic selenocysteine-containing dehydrogenase
MDQSLTAVSRRDLLKLAGAAAAAGAAGGSIEVLRLGPAATSPSRPISSS